MGFGILLIGYLLLIPLPFFGGIDLYFLAFGIMFSALLRLIPYEETFRYAKLVAIPLIPLCTVVSGIYLLRALHLLGESEGAEILVWLESVKRALVFVYHVFLLRAMGRLAKEVGREKITRKCRRDLVLVTLYFAAMLLLNLPLPFVQVLREKYVGLLLLFDMLWIFVMLFCAVQIYSCYMWICPEGEEEKPLKMGFFGKLLPGGPQEKDEAERELSKSPDREKNAGKKKKKKR